MSGTAKSLNHKLIAFSLLSDTDPFVIVMAGPPCKKITCLAEVACQSTQSMGLTELGVEGHELAPLLQDGLRVTVYF